MLFNMQRLATEEGVEVFSPVSHTLFDPVDTIQKALLYSILNLICDYVWLEVY